MKRSGPLKRKTPLARTCALKRSPIAKAMRGLAELQEERLTAGSGLSRKTPLRRTAFKRKPPPPNRAGSDPAHLAWVRKQPCAVCGTTRNVEAHHPRLGNGMSRKAPDSEAFPLCYRHHQVEFHGARGYFANWSKTQRHEWQLARSAECRAKRGAF